MRTLGYLSPGLPWTSASLFYPWPNAVYITRGNRKRSLAAVRIMDLAVDLLYLHSDPLWSTGCAPDSQTLALQSLGGKRAHFSGLLKQQQAVGGSDTWPMV